MRDWTCIQGDEAPTGNGLIYAQNVSIALDGECQRRKGMSYVASLAPKLIAPNFFPGFGYMAIIFTSTGTVETVSL